MPRVGDALLLAKYSIGDISILDTNTSKITIIPKTYISSFAIEKKYMELYMPILIIKVSVDREMFNLIQSTQGLKYNINISKHDIMTNDENFMNTGITKYPQELVLSGMYINYNDGETVIDVADNLEDDARDSDILSSERAPAESMQYTVDLFLFKDGNITDHKEMNDRMFTKCNIPTAVHYLAQIRSIKKYIMSPPDNNAVYDSMVLPCSLSFKSGLHYIQESYGIYSTGLIVFNDFDRLYILSGEGKVTAWETGELKDVHIELNDLTTSKGNTYGSYVDYVNNRYFINTSGQPAINDLGSMNSSLMATEYAFVDPYNNTMDKRSIRPVRANNKKDIAIMDNSKNNEYAKNTFMYNLSLINISVSIDMEEVDFSIITPNKRYYFDFSVGKHKHSEKYSGYYKIISADTIAVATGDHFTSKTRCSFRKI